MVHLRRRKWAIFRFATMSQIECRCEGASQFSENSDLRRRNWAKTPVCDVVVVIVANGGYGPFAAPQIGNFIK